MKDTFRDMIKNKKELNATAFIADQSPSPYKAHWMNFLNQYTPVFMGTEKIVPYFVKRIMITLFKTKKCLNYIHTSHSLI